MAGFHLAVGFSHIGFSMILALDSYHRGGRTRTAGVAVAALGDAEAKWSHSHDGPILAPYEAGALYKRELPGLLTLLADLEKPPTLIFVDGYVTLADGVAGLGAHLFSALKGTIPVIGVAKSEFHGASGVSEVFRGVSQRPLYVTAAGMTLADAARAVRTLHGPHRIPTLLQTVDALSRLGMDGHS